MDRIDRDDPLLGEEERHDSPVDATRVIDFDVARFRRVVADLNFRVSRYANTDRFYEEYEIALYEYFEGRGIYCEDDEDIFEYFQSEQDLTKFIAWYSYYYITDEFSRTFPELYLMRKKSQLSPLEKEILQSYVDHCLSIFEVQKVDLGQGVEIKDIFDGGLYYIWDGDASRNLYKWDLLYAGILKVKDLCFFSGMPLTTIPLKLRHFIEGNIVEFFQEQKEDYASLEHYLRKASAEILALIENASLHLQKPPFPFQAKASPQFMVTVHWRIREPGVFSRDLQQSGLLTDEAVQRMERFSRAKGRYVSFDEKDFDDFLGSVVRRMRISGLETLVAECESVEQAKKLRVLFGQRFGQGLRYHMMVYRKVDPAAANSPEGSAETAKEAREPDGEEPRKEGATRKYENWVNEKSPDIGNLTPREAMKTPEGRSKVLELLKEFENQNEKVIRRGLKNAEKLVFPLDKVKRELGL
jgi:hypothetical protein